MKSWAALLCAGLAACASVPPSSLYDARPPEISEYLAQPAMLVFSKTRGWRHNEGIAGASLFLADYTTDAGLGFFTTENAAVFGPGHLARFDIMIFNNVSGDSLSPAQEAALQQWILAGGALVALHGSGDNSHTDWPWYDKKVIGPEFIGHPADPQFQQARVVNLAPKHPVMHGIPADWLLTDEWYSFDGTAALEGATPLLGLDENTYSPENLLYGPQQDLRMGNDPAQHPIAWARCMGNGRVVYSAIGHDQSNYRDPIYRRFLANAIAWTRAAGSGAAAGC
ncbi:ThuA domain-containing protein [Paraurantiacibacter namhicola]|uniref:Trehalose utilization n=1 Tax=Paraurantiacibacter namhicola TaxID=645517 RepID=A0A1C7D963_9SPHN|nr:ThuA domain-containing protein [Paraurantiacibacter namhicola]ANU07843.1 Trehalose utilization [Paraurantiacibacter namhicola]